MRRMGALTCLDGCIFNITKIAAEFRIAFKESEERDKERGFKEKNSNGEKIKKKERERVRTDKQRQL